MESGMVISLFFHGLFTSFSLYLHFPLDLPIIIQSHLDILAILTKVLANLIILLSTGVAVVYHDATRVPLRQILSTPPLSVLPPPPTTIHQRPQFTYHFSVSPEPVDLTAAGIERHRRGQQLIAEANGANPYRVRSEIERARSRSPCGTRPQPGYQDPQYERGPRATGAVCPSYSLLPPHQHTPIRHVSDANISPEIPGRGRFRGMALDSNGLSNIDSPLDASHDPNRDTVLRDLCRNLHSPDLTIDGVFDARNASDEESDIPVCEFAAPCRLNGSPDGYHFRKVVSHVFGRNKAVTKIFPQDVWVHYCRKHYQRARYRADQWPFTQCDLLLESLRRMQEWNGVESWDLDLRRREKIRVKTVNGELGKPTKQGGSTKTIKDADNQAPLKNTRPGRKHPTAIIAPAPDWLHQSIGEKKTFDEIRSIIERVREYMSELRRREREHQTRSPPTTPEAEQGDLYPRARPKRAPKAKIPKLRPAVSMVRFPDVEILPRFKLWVKEAALRQRSATAPSLDDDTTSPVPKQNTEVGHAIPIIEDTHGRTPQHPMGHSISDLPYRLSPRTQSAQCPTFALMTPAATTPSRGFQGAIGRAGTNRGNSASQQRRSERVYQQALERVSLRGSVKKPNKPDQQ
jgi:hypothetical protein